MIFVLICIANYLMLVQECLSKKDLCIVETGNPVFTNFYCVSGSFPVSVDIYILVKCKVYFVC